jgi:hypothetical protein
MRSSSDSTSKPDDDATSRRTEFQQRFRTAVDLKDKDKFGTRIRLYETCLFVDGVASPADYMSTVFRNSCQFDNSTIKLLRHPSYDEWLPFDLWSIVAAFVAPTKPLVVTTTEKSNVHLRIANELSRTTVKENHPHSAEGKLWLFNQTLHHMNAVIDLDKTSRRSYRAALYLRNQQYQAALVDYNYDLFHRQPPLAPKDSESAYRWRSDVLFGLNDIAGAIDSRSNAVRVSANLQSVAADFARIDGWRGLLAKQKLMS